MLADDVKAELAQDRGGGIAFEEELKRRPDEFPGGRCDRSRGRLGTRRARAPGGWCPQLSGRGTVPSAWRVTVIGGMPYGSLAAEQARLAGGD